MNELSLSAPVTQTKQVEKFKVHDNVLEQEKNIKVLEPPREWANKIAREYFKSKIETCPFGEREWWYYQKVKYEVKDLQALINTAFETEVSRCMEGRSKYNQSPRCTWGTRPLQCWKDITQQKIKKKFLYDGMLSLLANKIPETKEEAYLFVKYILMREQPGTDFYEEYRSVYTPHNDPTKYNRWVGKGEIELNPEHPKTKYTIKKSDANVLPKDPMSGHTLLHATTLTDKSPEMEFGAQIEDTEVIHGQMFDPGKGEKDAGAPLIDTGSNESPKKITPSPDDWTQINDLINEKTPQKFYERYHKLTPFQLALYDFIVQKKIENEPSEIPAESTSTVMKEELLDEHMKEIENTTRSVREQTEKEIMLRIETATGFKDMNVNKIIQYIEKLKDAQRMIQEVISVPLSALHGDAMKLKQKLQIKSQLNIITTTLHEINVYTELLKETFNMTSLEEAPDLYSKFLRLLNDKAHLTSTQREELIKKFNTNFPHIKNLKKEDYTQMESDVVSQKELPQDTEEEEENIEDDMSDIIRMPSKQDYKEYKIDRDVQYTKLDPDAKDSMADYIFSEKAFSKKVQDQLTDIYRRNIETLVDVNTFITYMRDLQDLFSIDQDKLKQLEEQTLSEIKKIRSNPNLTKEQQETMAAKYLQENSAASLSEQCKRPLTDLDKFVMAPFAYYLLVAYINSLIYHNKTADSEMKQSITAIKDIIYDLIQNFNTIFLVDRIKSKSLDDINRLSDDQIFNTFNQISNIPEQIKIVSSKLFQDYYKYANIYSLRYAEQVEIQSKQSRFSFGGLKSSLYGKLPPQIEISVPKFASDELKRAPFNNLRTYSYDDKWRYATVKPAYTLLIPEEDIARYNKILSYSTPLDKTFKTNIRSFLISGNKESVNYIDNYTDEKFNELTKKGIDVLTCKKLLYPIECFIARMMMTKFVSHDLKQNKDFNDIHVSKIASTLYNKTNKYKWAEKEQKMIKFYQREAAKRNLRNCFEDLDEENIPLDVLNVARYFVPDALYTLKPEADPSFKKYKRILPKSRVSLSSVPSITKRS